MTKTVVELFEEISVLPNSTAEIHRGLNRLIRDLKSGKETDLQAELKENYELRLEVGTRWEPLVKKLRAEVKRLGDEVEELMHVDYWQDRHNIVKKENDELKKKLEACRMDLEIRAECLDIRTTQYNLVLAELAAIQAVTAHDPKK